MRFPQLIRHLVSAAFIGWSGMLFVAAQEVELTDPPSPAPPAESKPLQTLRALYANLDIALRDRDAKQNDLDSAATAAEKADIANDINAINETITGLRADVESVTAGVDIRQLENDLESSIKLDEEFQELVQPIVQELKRATAKPREVEQLRNAVTFHKLRRDLAEKALVRVSELIAEAPDDELMKSLLEAQSMWTQRLEQFTNELTNAQYQLDQRLSEDESLLSSIQDATATFFRTRGKNLLIAGLAVTSVFLLMRLLHSFVRQMTGFRGRKRSFGSRLIDVVYYGFTILLTIIAGLLAFYVMGDWMLLGFSLLLLTGFAWASKTTLPAVFEQAKLLLNLGAVREGERIIYKDVPWEVRRIGIFTNLVNPALEGGNVRLPLRDLIPLHSRPYEPKEPFFPTEQKNWILLADGTLGKIIHQTPEWVQIILLGGSVKTYTIADFIGLVPQNLSRGFRLSVTFGIDYSHQKLATKKIPEVLQDRLENRLATLFGREQLVNLQVEFANAGASSLDYAVQADFDGEAASKYFRIQRAIQSICVDTCNEFRWAIPFTQITIHSAPPSGK
ncbi:MAG: hypothetical protein R3F19_22050 [Verrucomicrobiales bacterium]